MEHLVQHLAWPIVGLVLGLTSILLFKRELSVLICKVRKIDKTGISTGPEQGQALTETKPTSFQELMDSVSSGLLRERESEITHDLGAKGIQSDQEKIRLLTRGLAATSLVREWLEIERSIYGSQLALLIDLNTKPQGLADSEAKPFYDAAVSHFPATYSNYTFQQYMGYLVANNLVRHDSSRFYITPRAKEFMAWIVMTGKTYVRPN